MKHLVTAGCSFTLDNYQKTWANYLADASGYTLTNIGARGAGIDFISKRILFHCSKNRPDLLVIMLPSVDRFDWYVDEHHPLAKSAVEIASWQDGQRASLLNLNGITSQTEGYSLSGGEIRGDKRHWFKYYYSETSALLNYWTAVYNLENFLKLKQIPYFFTTAYDRDNLVEQTTNMTGNSDSFKWIFDLIDWNKFIFYQETQGFLSFTRARGYAITKNHPVTEAHLAWVEEILTPAIITL
jgi:hypothetical protein